jgi:hypothetical protein
MHGIDTNASGRTIFIVSGRCRAPYHASYAVIGQTGPPPYGLGPRIVAQEPEGRIETQPPLLK